MYSCALGSATTFDTATQSFHFDYSQDSLITCPYDISPSKHSDLTIEIVFKLDEDYNPATTEAWIIGQDNGGFDRSLMLSDNRFGGVGSGIGSTYNSGISSPTVGIWHHGLATFRQSVKEGSFVAIDGVIGKKVTAFNGDGNSAFTIGGAVHPHHGIKGLVKSIRIFETSFDEETAKLAYAGKGKRPESNLENYRFSKFQEIMQCIVRFIFLFPQIIDAPSQMRICFGLQRRGIRRQQSLFFNNATIQTSTRQTAPMMV